ncbi:MAG TPA: DUF6569 family protein [Aridibacter sp.]|nr:DUF6569 family protein [Aridibacter sp.]
MNSKRMLSVATAVLSLAAGLTAAYLYWPGETTKDAGETEAITQHALAGTGLTVSGPFKHKNLSIFLVHGKDSLNGRTPLTLEEAMKRKLVTVHETGDVGELAIENVSKTEEVFVQAGDIVKGGKQDRVLTVDLIVPARSGRLPIESFCVEQGRWNGRGSESPESFGSSTDYASSKELKIAAKHARSQTEVWQGVANTQNRLSDATNSNVASEVSGSSLPLTLENENVRARASDYVNSLEDIVSGKSDVIGFVFAINGRLNSAEVYGSRALFLKLWPKLLRASAIEAVAESLEHSKPGSVTTAGTAEFLDRALSADVSEKRVVIERVTMVTRESKQSMLLESRDRDVLLHRSYLNK